MSIGIKEALCQSHSFPSYQYSSLSNQQQKNPKLKTLATTSTTITVADTTTIHHHSSINCHQCQPSQPHDQNSTNRRAITMQKQPNSTQNQLYKYLKKIKYKLKPYISIASTSISIFGSSSKVLENAKR